MRKRGKILLGIGIGTFLLLVVVLIIPVLILDQSWWWLLGIFIFDIIVWAVTGLTILFINLKTKQEKIEEIDLSRAEEIARQRVKTDPDNGDNLIIKSSHSMKIGQQGSDITPVGLIIGFGTEKMQVRVIVINMKNPEKDITSLINPTKEEIKEACRIIADYPPGEERLVDIETDPFTGTIRKRQTVRPSSYQEKQRKEEEKIEEESAI